jgi:hypothetical protein
VLKKEDLRLFYASTLYSMWYERATLLIGRGHASADEIAELNTIALAYQDRTGIPVYLSGKDVVEKAKHVVIHPPIDSITTWHVAKDEPEEEQADAPLWVLKSHENDDIHGRHYVEFADGEGWWEAGVRRDGCIHLTRYYNLPWGGDTNEEKDSNSDYLHICYLDETIKRLQALKEAACAAYGGDWPL